jgi:hypothetical protein
MILSIDRETVVGRRQRCLGKEIGCLMFNVAS